MKFSVKPTEREKRLLENKPTYDGWIIVHKDSVVLSAHNEASHLEDMTFTKPEIAEKKKTAEKPSTSNYDPRPKQVVNNDNLVAQFRGLLINTVPSAEGLHILPDPGLNEATEAIDEITEQTSTNGAPLTSTLGNPSG